VFNPRRPQGDLLHRTGRRADLLRGQEKNRIRRKNGEIRRSRGGEHFHGAPGPVRAPPGRLYCPARPLRPLASPWRREPGRGRTGEIYGVNNVAFWCFYAKNAFLQ